MKKAICQEPPIRDGWHSHSIADKIQVVLECLKFIRIFNKPEICIANFSVHAQDFSININAKASRACHQSETGWKILTFLIGVFVVLVLQGCVQDNHIPINIENNSISEAKTEEKEVKTLPINKEGLISQEECEERNLQDKIIILQSEYCDACKVVMPILEEIKNELGTEFISLDLSDAEDRAIMDEFKIIPSHTPTVLIGCNVYIGVKPKEIYKEKIQELLEKVK